MIKILLCLICLVITFSSSATSASNVTSCLQACHLNVQNSEIVHLQYVRTINDGTTRVVYFDILNDAYYNVNATLYAWVRDNVGQPMFSLPIDYIAVSLNLPAAFIHYQPINFTESTLNCYRQSSFFCQEILVMSALVKVTRLNNRCNGTNCGSLCRRHFHLRHIGDRERDEYACCSEKSLEKEIDLVQCLQPNRLLPYISILTIFTIVLGVLLSFSTVIMISNRVIKYLGSTIIVKKSDKDTDNNSTNQEKILVHLLSPVSTQTSKYHYFKYLMVLPRRWRITHYVVFGIISILAIAGACLSLLIQTQPLTFVSGLVIVTSDIPWSAIIPGIVFIAFYIISISCIRYTINADNINKWDSGATKPIRFRWRLKRPLHRFFILNRLNIWRPMQFISQFIRVYNGNKNISYHPSEIVRILSWLLGLITVVAIMIVLQIVFRIIISVSIFIIAYSLYFSNVITIAIPFVYYFYLVHHYYYKRHDFLCFGIVKALSEVENQMKRILNATEGEIEVYFKFKRKLLSVIKGVSTDIRSSDSCIKEKLRCEHELKEIKNSQSANKVSKVPTTLQVGALASSPSEHEFLAMTDSDSDQETQVISENTVLSASDTQLQNVTTEDTALSSEDSASGQETSDTASCGPSHETNTHENTNSSSSNTDERLESSVALRSPDPYTVQNRKLSTATHSRIAQTMTCSSKVLQHLTTKDTATLGSSSILEKKTSNKVKSRNNQRTATATVEESEEILSSNTQHQDSNQGDNNLPIDPTSTEQKEIEPRLKAEIDQLWKWVEVDLPEMLIEHHDEIKTELLRVFCDQKVGFHEGTYRVIFNFTRNKKRPRNISIDIPSCNDYHLYEGCTKDLEPLASNIKTYLETWNIEKFRKKLTKVHYRIGKIDTVDCVGIPEKLFKWISYHSPVLSLSYFSLLWQYIILLGLFTSLILSIPAYSFNDALADFNTTLSKLPVTLAIILTVVKFFHRSHIDREYEGKLILSHLISYRRGYRLFYQVDSNTKFLKRNWKYFKSFFGCSSQEKSNEDLMTPSRAETRV